MLNSQTNGYKYQKIRKIIIFLRQVKFLKTKGERCPQTETECNTKPAGEKHRALIVAINLPTKNLTHILHPVTMAGFLLVIRLHTYMGESRMLNIPQIGDMDRINFDEGVLTGRELLLRMEITSA